MNKFCMAIGTLSLLLFGACSSEEEKISDVVDATEDLQTLPPDVDPELPEPYVYETDEETVDTGE